MAMFDNPEKQYNEKLQSSQQKTHKGCRLYDGNIMLRKIQLRKAKHNKIPIKSTM